jgi:hypothetical protein
MLEKLQLKIDNLVSKCSFSSIMKHNVAYSLGAMLVALLINSCATNGGGGYGAASDANRSDSPMKPATTGSVKKTPIPEDRPGLATGWGREKRSEMTDTEFARASSKPAGIDSIYYNDAKGIKAMTSYVERVAPMQEAAGGLIEWGVKGSTGFLTAYKERGYGRRLVAGGKDGTYSIMVKNRCKSALEIVASVDGLDVQDGKPASFSKRGYIVEAGKTLEIEGFRTSQSRVAAFKFSSVSNSYANLRHGNTRNVGVIGIAVFTRKNVNPWTWMPDEVKQRTSASPFATAP